MNIPKFLAVLIALSTIVSFGVAQQTGIPSKPHFFYGEVSLTNPPQTSQGLQAGTVEARVGGNVAGSLDYSGGTYGGEGGYEEKLLVEGVSNGDTIKFYVNGLKAEEKATFESGDVTQLDLTVDVPPEDTPVTVSSAVEEAGPDKDISVEVPPEASKDAGGVEKVDISVGRNVKGVNINVTTSIDRPENVDDVSEGFDVYGYIDIEVGGGMTDDDVSSAVISFKVATSRTDNPDGVVLLHFKDGSWNPLNTTHTSSDSSFHHFEAVTGSFSFFSFSSDTEDPQARMDVSSTSVKTGDRVRFDASDSSDNVGITSYSWEFGDGESGSGETVSHTYSETGDFTVELTLRDKAGNTDSTAETVSASSPTGKDITQTQGPETVEEQPPAEEEEQPPEEPEEQPPEEPEEQPPEDEQDVQQFGPETGPQGPQGPAGPTGFIGAVSSNAAPIAAVLLLLLVGALYYFGIVEFRNPFGGRGAEQPSDYSHRD